MSEQDIETLRQGLARMRRQARAAVDPKVAEAYTEMAKAYETRIGAIQRQGRRSNG